MKSLHKITLVLFALLFTIHASLPTNAQRRRACCATYKNLVGYFGSWADIWTTDGTVTQLAKLPPYITIVNLAFMRPDTNYSSIYDISMATTGLEFAYDGPTLQSAITTLRSRNPGVRILVAVGGSSPQYNTWSQLHTQNIVQFVNDFGLDGVDIDYEPASVSCSLQWDGQVRCSTDAEFISVVQQVRAALPTKMISIAAYSVGAYGEGAWATAAPSNTAHTGMAIQLLRQAGSSIDIVNVMSYDVGTSAYNPALMAYDGSDTINYNPVKTLQAYKSYFTGSVMMGVEVPPEGYGSHVYTLSEVDALAQAVMSNGGSGMMLWYIQKSNPTPSENYPSAQMIAQKICQRLVLSGCQNPLLP